MMSKNINLSREIHVTHYDERSGSTAVVSRVVAFVGGNEVMHELFLNQVQVVLSRVETNHR